MEEKYQKMLEAITANYNKKWIAAGGNHQISEKEALEILIEDTFNEIMGYDYSWNEICKQRSN